MSNSAVLRFITNPGENMRLNKILVGLVFVLGTLLAGNILTSHSFLWNKQKRPEKMLAASGEGVLFLCKYTNPVWGDSWEGFFFLQKGWESFDVLVETNGQNIKTGSKKVGYVESLNLHEVCSTELEKATGVEEKVVWIKIRLTEETKYSVITATRKKDVPPNGPLPPTIITERSDLTP